MIFLYILSILARLRNPYHVRNHFTPQQRPPESRDRVFTRMKQLYAQTATDTPDDKRILDGMSSLIIGKTTQRLTALIAQETGTSRRTGNAG